MNIQDCILCIKQWWCYKRPVVSKRPQMRLFFIVSPKIWVKCAHGSCWEMDQATSAVTTVQSRAQMMRRRIKLSPSIVQLSIDWKKGVWMLFRISESEPLLSEKGINITMKHPSVRLQHAKQSAEMWAVSGIKWENNGWGRVKTLLGGYKANSWGYGSHAGVKERKSNYIMHCYRVEPHNSNFSNS